MRRIDSHQHFWRLSRGDYAWITPEMAILNRDYEPSDLKPLLQRNGVEGTILVEATDTVEETRFMLSLADNNDFVRGVVGWIDFESGEALATLDGLAGHPKFSGVRPMLQDLPDDRYMLRDGFTPLYRSLAETGLTFDALVRPRHLPHLLELLSRHPRLRCVIDHGAKPEIRNNAFDSWAKDIGRLARETDACCKLSGLVTEAAPGWTEETLRPYVDHLIACFGAERLMFGSDWPVLNLAGDYDRWIAAVETLTSDLGETARAAIWAGTAERFYRLK